MTILSKSTQSECSTAWAQGGVAAVVNSSDNIQNHCRDTINNGHNICNPKSVKQIVQQGKISIDLLEELGANFNKKAKIMIKHLRVGTRIEELFIIMIILAKRYMPLYLLKFTIIKK